MTEKGKERLKKLGKIALGLGALGAAGAGTYYAAKNGHLGDAAQKYAETGQEKLKAGMDAIKNKSVEYYNDSKNWLEDHLSKKAEEQAANPAQEPKG